jgi:hypothetical protein
MDLAQKRPKGANATERNETHFEQNLGTLEDISLSNAGQTNIHALTQYSRCTFMNWDRNVLVVLLLPLASRLGRLA